MTDLKRILALLYPSEVNARGVLIAGDVQIDPHTINLVGAPLERWQRILEEASKYRKVPNIVQHAAAEFENRHAELRDALEQYQVLEDLYALGPLLENLASGDSLQRQEAAEQIGESRRPGAVGVLERRWDDEEDFTVKHWIALSLGAIGGDDAVAALKRLRARETEPFAQLGIESALESLVGKKEHA